MMAKSKVCVVDVHMMGYMTKTIPSVERSRAIQNFTAIGINNGTTTRVYSCSAANEKVWVEEKAR
jgi:hypothetical protein